MTPLTRALELEGYTVTAVGNGAEALDAAGSAQPDVVVLDVSMPIVDGLTVCKVLRADGNRVPILMLTARTETRDRVAGLDAGADDYLPKPFELDELLARLRALLRRAHTDGMADAELVQLADLRLDPAARRAWRGDRELDLSKTEFDLLELLVRNQGVVLDHSTIYDRIWHYDFGPDSKNLAVYIGYLRRKTEADGEPRLIQTVRGRRVLGPGGPGRRVRLMSLRLAHRVGAGGDRRGDHDLGGHGVVPRDERPPAAGGRQLARHGVAARSRTTRATAATPSCSTCTSCRSSPPRRHRASLYLGGDVVAPGPARPRRAAIPGRCSTTSSTHGDADVRLVSGCPPAVGPTSCCRSVARWTRTPASSHDLQDADDAARGAGDGGRRGARLADRPHGVRARSPA